MERCEKAAIGAAFWIAFSFATHWFVEWQVTWLNDWTEIGRILWLVGLFYFALSGAVLLKPHPGGDDGTV